MRARNNRGKNSVTFIFGERSTESKVRKLRSFRGSQIKYLMYKEKTEVGFTKIPKAVNVIFKAGYSRSTRYRYKKRTGLELPKYFYQSFLSPPDYVIKPQSVLDFASDKLAEYDSKYSELIEQEYDEDMEIYNVRELTIVFIY